VTLKMDEEKGNFSIDMDDFEKEIDTQSHKAHNGRKIDEIIVSRYMDNDPYVVTYSKEDNSIQGWSVNVGKNERPDVNYDLNQHGIKLYKLYNKYLTKFCYSVIMLIVTVSDSKKYIYF
jgi:hypothetical protein